MGVDFGKSELLGGEACLEALKGGKVGWFAPDYKRLEPSYRLCKRAVQEILFTSNKTTGFLETIIPFRHDPREHSSIEFWTLNDEDAGRSRAYNLVIIDEAAFAPLEMMQIWQKAIEPTLLDYKGRVLVASNTNGIDDQQFFWRICNEEGHGFGPKNEDGTFGFHATAYDNPLIPKDELDLLKLTRPPNVWAQEYCAEFVDWSGDAFFLLEWMLSDQGLPTADSNSDLPRRIDSVYAVIDTATKTGREHDGTAVVYFGKNTLGDNIPLTILDWDIQKIEGALLETWLPVVCNTLEELARETGARFGVLGVWIEDKGSGQVLIQQAERRGINSMAIDPKFTSLGKDERAINVSGYFFQKKVRLAKRAYDRVKIYNGVSRNHLLSQISAFRIGDRESARRADDLLDCVVYGAAIGLGDSHGF